MTSDPASILVTGGCGLLGYHVVQALLKDLPNARITSVSRNPKDNILQNVNYLAGSINDVEFVERIFTETKPEVVIHTASPRSLAEGLEDRNLFETNIGGTQSLLEASKKSPSTRAFVYSSTVNVISGTEHKHVAENDLPYWTMRSKIIPYWRSKAEGEKMVLAADCDELHTVALRPCMIIGKQEHSLIPTQLDALAQGRTKVQLGNNKNLFDTVSAQNVAEAHILAMHALLDPSKANGQVAGEAFNITDDNPLPFWDVQRIIWRTGGDTTELKDIKVIPAWLATTMASVAEIFYGVFFFGGRSPELTRHVVNFCTRTFTYDISKAKRVLGYSPSKRTEENLREATEWEVQRRAEEAKNCKS